MAWLGNWVSERKIRKLRVWEKEKHWEGGYKGKGEREEERERGWGERKWERDEEREREGEEVRKRGRERGRERKWDMIHWWHRGGGGRV
jgi:hypothetical protein